MVINHVSVRPGMGGIHININLWLKKHDGIHLFKGDVWETECLRLTGMILQVRHPGDNVDGSEILHHLGCIKPCKWWDKLPTSTGWPDFRTIKSITVIHFPNYFQEIHHLGSYHRNPTIFHPWNADTECWTMKALPKRLTLKWSSNHLSSLLGWSSQLP